MANTVPSTDSAREFIKKVKKMPVPRGKTRDTMLPAVLEKSPLAALAAVIEFIELNQELMSIDANKPVLDRMRGENGVMNIVTELAIGPSPENLPGIERKLQAALEIRGVNVWEMLEMAIKNIARDQKIQLEREELHDDERGKPPVRPVDGKCDEMADQGTWRENLHRGPQPDISDADVRRAAEQHDKDAAPPNEQDIRRSAQQVGDKPFRPDARDLTEYERMERRGIGDDDFHHEQFQARHETQAYYTLVRRIRAAFDNTLGKQVYPQAVAGRSA